VAAYGIEIALAVCLPRPEGAETQFSFLLHDIGKVAMPDAILFKPGALSHPDGLRAEEIPLAARAFAVADVLDALTTDRPYRPRLPLAEARAMIVEASGTQFDPMVVGAFQQIDDATIVILTAAHGDRIEAAAEQAGADLFLTKPFSPLELLRLVDRLGGNVPA
jgi:response regulator RpfG family c-di-GMP phosphodiesterase